MPDSYYSTASSTRRKSFLQSMKVVGSSSGPHSMPIGSQMSSNERVSCPWKSACPESARVPDAHDLSH